MGVVCARAVHTVDSSNDLLASRTCCLPFFLQLALDCNGLCTPRRDCIRKILYRRSDKRFRQDKRPRSFDIGVSKIWPCASQKPTRLTTEKSGSSPSAWDHNHTSVEEQDLCTIQASHGILHKKKKSHQGTFSKRSRTNNASRTIGLLYHVFTPSNAQYAPRIQASFVGRAEHANSSSR